jgi:hypothetical protein
VEGPHHRCRGCAGVRVDALLQVRNAASLRFQCGLQLLHFLLQLSLPQMHKPERLAETVERWERGCHRRILYAAAMQSRAVAQGHPYMSLSSSAPSKQKLTNHKCVSMSVAGAEVWVSINVCKTMCVCVCRYMRVYIR